MPDDWEMIQHDELHLDSSLQVVSGESSNLGSNQSKSSHHALSLFEIVGTIPAISSARFLSEINSPEGVILYELISSVRDLTRKSKRKWVHQGVYLQSANQNILSPGQEFTELGIVQVSPDGKLKAQTRTTKDNKRFIEIHGSVPLVKSFDVTKVHETFGSLEWSRDQSKLVYVAEEPAPSEDAPEYTWKGDWGEGFSGKRRPTIIVFDIVSGVATPLKLELTVSKPVISPDGNQIYFVGFEELPLKFGVRFCNNRRSRVYRVNIDGTGLESLSPQEVHSRSPCLTPDGTKLLYLSNPIGGPHNSCAQLNAIHLTTKKQDTIVSVVRNPDGANDFPGLYTDGLSRHAFSSSGDYLLIQSISRSRDVIWAIHLETGVPTLLTPEKEYSWSLLDVSGDLVLATKSTYNTPSRLMLGTLSTNNGTFSATWKELPCLSHSASVSNILDNTDVTVAVLPSRSLDLEVTLISPKSGDDLPFTKNGKGPLIVLPHGGPHSTTTLAYSFFVAGFVSLGHHCLMVNYRGSLGFGQNNVEALVGKIGDLDLEDVHAAALWATQRSAVDSDRVGLFGGSHGGFITAHLLGRYPDFYKLGVLRNPVINVGAMVANSDIPDWCFAEAGISFDQSKPHLLTPHEYEKAFAMSPASVAYRVKGAVLLLLGDKDRRVPHSEGLRWGQYLRGQGKNVKIMMYPEVGHGLDTFEAEKGSFLETIKLFEECFL